MSKAPNTQYSSVAPKDVTIPGRICRGCSTWVYLPQLLCAACQAVGASSQDVDMGSNDVKSMSVSPLLGHLSKNSFKDSVEDPFEHDVINLHWPEETTPNLGMDHAPTPLPHPSAPQQLRETGLTVTTNYQAQRQLAAQQPAAQRVHISEPILLETSTTRRAPGGTYPQAVPQNTTIGEVCAAAALLELGSQPATRATAGWHVGYPGMPVQAGYTYGQNAYANRVAAPPTAVGYALVNPVQLQGPYAGNSAFGPGTMRP